MWHTCRTRVSSNQNHHTRVLDFHKGPKIDQEFFRLIRSILNAKGITVDVEQSWTEVNLDVSKKETPRTRTVGPTCRGTQNKIAPNNPQGLEWKGQASTGKGNERKTAIGIAVPHCAYCSTLSAIDKEVAPSIVLAIHIFLSLFTHN